MTRIVAFLVRCVVILVGYAVACLAASAFIHMIVLAGAGFQPQDARDVPAAALGPFAFSVPFVALFMAYFAFIPAAAAIVLAEILSRRDWLFYALAGAIVTGAVLVFLERSREAGSALGDTTAILALIGAGIVGGFFYWLVAGRGASLPVQPPISPPR